MKDSKSESSSSELQQNRERRDSKECGAVKSCQRLSREAWRKICEGYERSGASMKSYSAACGVSYKQLLYRLKKHQGAESSESSKFQAIGYLSRSEYRVKLLNGRELFIPSGSIVTEIAALAKALEG